MSKVAAENAEINTHPFGPLSRYEHIDPNIRRMFVLFTHAH